MPRVTESHTSRGGRLRRSTGCALAASLAAGMLSTVALVAATPGIAAAATTPVAASWSSSPNCSTWVTAAPPAGTVSATLTLSGAGGGGGATNSGSGGSGGSGGAINATTFALTHATGAVAVKLGCGGAGGTTGGGGGSSIGGAAGGAGYATGAASGGASDESVSVDGISSGGGGGGASGLCLGSTGCTTALAVAGGGGGGGSRWDCTGSTGPGTGGNGQTGGTTTFSAGAAGTNGDGSDGTGGGGGASTSGGGGGGGDSSNGSNGANSPYASAGGSGGGGGGGFPVEAGASGGGGGGGYTGGGGGGGDKCTSGSDAGGGGGGGSSAVNSSYASSVAYATGSAGGGTSATGTAGSITLTWNVDNLSVTNPGTQSNVSGSAISNLTITGSHDTTNGNSVTYSATGLPAGLSISSGGVVSGTPTTACACSVTVTATDSEALTATTSFTWNITNTVSVANPGAKSSVTGTAITPVTDSATDSQSGATLTWSATGLPAGLSISSSTGTISGTPTTAGSSPVTVKATDGAGYSGTASFTWTVTNTVAVANPGTQSSLSGTAITPVTDSATDTQSGATLTWSATGLPAGLSISSSTGTISGTPTTAGSSSVTVKATDGAGFSGTASFTWTISNTVAVANPGNQSSLSGSAITPVTDSATDSQSGATLTWSATGLPAGLSISSSTGTISGTPTTPGSSSVTVKATDPSGANGSTTFTWTISNTVAVANPGNQSAVTGTAITPVTDSATDSQSGATLTWSATGLPAGLSINSSSGTISGTPTAPCTCSVTLKATDGAGFSGSTTFTWTVANTVSVTGHGAQTDGSGTAIAPLGNSATDSQAGQSLSWSATGLPGGLAIDRSSGVISGTPTTGGTYGVTVTATDGAGFSGSTTFSWIITDDVVVRDPGPQLDASGTAISPLPASATDSGTGAVLTWSATGLPTGLTIDPSTGTVSGTPTTGGIYAPVVTATDGAGYSGSATFTWTVTNIVSVTDPGDQSDVSGQAIAPLAITASDSSSTASLTYAATGLPVGLAIDPSTGVITGTPTAASTSPVTVSATDGQDYTDSATFTWTVTDTVSVTNPGDQSDLSGSTIRPLTDSATDSATGQSLTWSATGLPAGLSIDPSTGTISGSPTMAGSYPVTLTATDGAGYSGSATFTWSVTNTVTVTSPGDQSSVSGTAIAPVTTGATDSSPTATLTWSATGLQAGLSIDPSTGTISGTPATGGTGSVAITATDDSGSTGSATFTWTVTDNVAVTSPGDQSSVSGTAIDPLAGSATDSGAGQSLTWSATGLPAGLSIDPSTGTISGTPTAAAATPVTLTATDGAGYSGSATFTWSVTNTVTVTSPGDQSSVSGTAIAPVTTGATDSSATATLTWSATGLQAGLSIDPSTGAVSGTPTTAGSSPVTLTATDGPGYSGSATFTWTVTDTVSVTSPGDQSSVSGTAIDPLGATATDSESDAVLTWSATGLPAGLSVDPSTGTISGTPTTAGSSPVTLTATDGAGYSGSATFTWTVTDTVSVTSPGDQTSASGTPVAPVTGSAVDSGSGQSVTWSATGLPAGLSIDPSTGTISGTPTTGGRFPVTVTATDGAGYSGSAAFTWTVTDTVSVTSPGDQSSVSGTAIAPLGAGATDSSATATLTWSATGLPAGLSVDPSTGTISGTPTTAGSSPVTLTATDGAGYSGSATFTWTVTNSVTVAPVADQTAHVGSAVAAVHVTATDSSPTASVTYSATGLPPGLAIAPTTGTITGTPTRSGVATVTVTATDGSGFSGRTGFTWTVTGPVITSVTPATGPASGGSKVTIVGTGLASPVSVDFAGSPGTSVKANHKGTKLTVLAPAHVAGTVDIVVTTAAGPTLVGPTDRFTYTPPTVSSLSVTSGPVAGGTKVKIAGSGLKGLTSVRFGSVTATVVAVNAKGTQVTVTSPPGSAGTADVTVTTPEGTSATGGGDRYTYR